MRSAPLLALALGVAAAGCRGREPIPPRFGDVSGLVVDDVTGDPVAGARVAIGEQDDDTDASGAFFLGHIGVGAQVLTIAHDAYLPFATLVPLDEGANVVGPLRLTPIFDAGFAIDAGFRDAGHAAVDAGPPDAGQPEPVDAGFAIDAGNDDGCGAGAHNGGDGACVAVGACSAGFFLADGGCTPWRAAGSLPLPISNHDVVAHDGRLFLIGGPGTGGEVHMGAINDAGAVGGWQLITTVPTSAFGHGVVATATSLVVVGGLGGGGPPADVVTADFVAGGLSDWRALPSLPAPRDFMAVTIVDATVWVFGGYVDTESETSTIYAADFDDAGVLGAWRSGGALSGGDAHSRVIHRQGVFHRLGDYHLTRQVQAARMDDGGTLTSWMSEPDVTTTTKYHAGVVLVQDRIVVVGGSQNVASAETQAASFNGDGLITGWTRLAPLPAPRTGPATAVVDGVLYVLGGAGTDGTHGDVYAADVDVLLSSRP